ncbi:unnamed protein product [Urochloa decumbens]|uniref:Uncharacterized protein n=1 Tax=Urochloa decumbens TaxID=240449 RepID=A0ABC9DZQ6_9POAL
MEGIHSISTTSTPTASTPSAARPTATLAAPSAPKQKPQRRLGLPMPPSTGGAAMPGAKSGTPHGGSGTPAPINEEGVGVKRTRKRPPRDPSSARAACKVRSTAAGPVPLQASPTLSESNSPAYSPEVGASQTPSAMPAMDSTDNVPTAQEVLCGMPKSLDDESFLNTMDVQTFGNTTSFDANIFDDELGSDVEGELPKKKGARGVNFTIDEDETL